MKKYKILIVHNFYQIPGGEDIVVANEKKLLEDNGHEVFLYSRSNDELKKMSLVKKLFFPIAVIFNYKTYRDIRKIIKKEGIDIVHVHNTLSIVSPAVYYAAISRKVPVVQTIHNFRMLCPSATFFRDGQICEDCVKKGLTCAIKHSCYRGNRIHTCACVIATWMHRVTGIYKKINFICLTEFTKNKLLHLKCINQRNVYVKPNFTVEMGQQRSRENAYLFVGRIEELKGIPLLIEAFSKMPDKKIMLAGTGTSQDLKKYQEEIRQRNADNIEFIGFVERKELAILLSKAKAVIVSSQCYETFGMVIIEAFSSHTPVIVGDIGNIASLVDDGINGMKFIYNDADDLIKTIIRFEKADMKIMGENGYKKFLKEFSQEVNYSRLMEIYNNVQFR